MLDWVVLPPSRWKLRRAIKAVNEVMAELRVEKHPDTTFIGWIARGIDFLGYWFSSSGLGVAKKTVERMLEKVSQLYEHKACRVRIETYLKHWWRWVLSGVDGVLRTGDRTGIWVGYVRYISLTHPTRSGDRTQQDRRSLFLLHISSSGLFGLYFIALFSGSLGSSVIYAVS